MKIAGKLFICETISQWHIYLLMYLFHNNQQLTLVLTP